FGGAVASAVVQLVVDPSIGLLHALHERNRGSPTELLLDHRIVAAAPADSFRRVEIEATLQPHSGNPLDDVDQLVDADELIAADVDGFGHVTRHERPSARHTVVDVREGPRLLAVAPDLDLALPSHERDDHLAADRSRRLLPSAVERPVGAVDVVVARDARRQPVVFGKVAAHSLTEELLP